jgi:hypothetical protein
VDFAAARSVAAASGARIAAPPDNTKRNVSIKPIGFLDWRPTVGTAMIYGDISALSAGDFILLAQERLHRNAAAARKRVKFDSRNDYLV